MDTRSLSSKKRCEKQTTGPIRQWEEWEQPLPKPKDLEGNMKTLKPRQSGENKAPGLELPNSKDKRIYLKDK